MYGACEVLPMIDEAEVFSMITTKMWSKAGTAAVAARAAAGSAAEPGGPAIEAVASIASAAIPATGVPLPFTAGVVVGARRRCPGDGPVNYWCGLKTAGKERKDLAGVRYSSRGGGSYSARMAWQDWATAVMSGIGASATPTNL